MVMSADEQLIYITTLIKVGADKMCGARAKQSKKNSESFNSASAHRYS